MTVEPVSEVDLGLLRELQPDGWSNILPVFNFYMDSPFCFPVKVKLDNVITGIGAGIIFGHTAWLAHIIVKADQRNKGVGSAIVDHLVNRLKGDGCESISLIATELGYPVYKKFGFVDQTDYVFFERSGPLKDQHLSENIVPYSADFAEKIFALDKTVSGEIRIELLVDKMENSCVYQRNGKVEGYYLPDLGEGLIVANDAETGIELMKLRSLSTNKSVVPVGNKVAIDFLIANGFLERKRAKRMILGKEFKWEPSMLFNRVAGNVG